MKPAKMVGKTEGKREFKEAKVRIPRLRNVDVLISEPGNSCVFPYQKEGSSALLISV